MEIKIPFEQWLELKKMVNDQVAIAAKKLRDYDHLKLENGLTPDHVRQTVGYQTDKKAYDQAFQKLRNFNQKSPKEYLRQASKLHRKNV